MSCIGFWIYDKTCKKKSRGGRINSQRVYKGFTSGKNGKKKAWQSEAKDGRIFHKPSNKI